MKKLAIALAAFVFVIAVSIFPFNTASAQFGGYMGVFGGYTLISDATMWYYDYYYNYDYDIDVQKTWAVGLKLGYTPPQLKYFSFEFEYSFLNPDVDRTVLTPAGTGYATIEGNAKFNNFMFNAFVKYPEGKIHPYIGVGLGLSYVDVSFSTTPTVRSANNDDTVFAGQILGGVDIDLTKNLSMDIGLRYFATEAESDHDYYHDYGYYSPHLDYRISMVTLGLKYRF